MNDPTYRREPRPETIKASKQETKTMIIARFGMLECGQNFKGTLKQICDQCNIVDDENHRLNHCIKWRDMNLYDSHEKVDMKSIHSRDIGTLRPLLSIIEKVWNVRTAHGTMNTI